VDIFADPYYVIDSEYATIGGQILGNYWAGKQWNYDNPNFVITGNVISFYASRIEENQVDFYEYDFNKRTLTAKGNA